MSVAIIANPLAGRGRGHRAAQEAIEVLKAENADFQLIYSEYPGHAIELARKASQNHPLVAALGGDGTIREVLEGTWQTSATLGILPGGTGNDYARGLAIPREIKPAIDVLLHGQDSLFDVGFQNSLPFGQMASIGFSVDVLEYVNNHRNGIWKGSAAFLAGVVATIRNLKSVHVKITVDSKVIERDIIALFALNMPYGGGGMKFVPEARYDSGLFHLLFIDSIGRLDLAVTLPKIYSAKHLNHPAVNILTGKEITIEGNPLPIMVDGDIFPPEPFHVTIEPQTMRVRTPKTPAQ